MEYLQRRVITLEEEAANYQAMKSPIMNEKISGAQLILPEIKARICNQTILVKIRCGNRKGRIVEILGEVENLNLAILNFNVATFATSVLDFTIIAKMEHESCPSENDIVTAIDDLLCKSGISV
ncbi:hypothetical protein ACS0TY_029853 [Phlomoides rotata]